ncbi:hypothetical protein [Xylanibacter caecicola]|uniref:hypothetical protein n=1 Tax=Xylanibacter caecicola TaxID=2736294 RepID=UPI0025854A68|nr:hypothetical protein [Xylanibacter caecicola]
METTNEMENMRLQLDVLKNRLEKQTVISDNMIRTAMKDKSHRIKLKYRTIILLSVVMIPYSLILLPHTGFSLPFSIVTSLFMLIAGVYTYYNIRALDNAFDSGDNMIEVGLKVAKAKKRDSDWLKYSIPAVIPWFIWFLIEALEKEQGCVFAIGGIIGGIIGGVIGMRMHMEVQRKYKEIIAHIEDIKEIC